MTSADAFQFTTQALVLALMLSLPAVLAATAVSLAIAVLQATTQVQDQTIGQAARLLTVAAVLFVTGSLIGNQLFDFAKEMFYALARFR